MQLLQIGMYLKSPLHKKKAVSGFTLIEVLIALLILAIALTAVLFTMQRSVQVAMRLKNKMAAHAVAMNVVAAMQTGLYAAPTAQQTQKGDSEMLGEHFTWQAGVEAGSNVGYSRIHVIIFLKQHKLEQIVAFIKTH